MSEPIYLGSNKIRLTMLRCPVCNGAADGATSISKKNTSSEPKAGDLTMCFYCGTMMFYEDSIASPCPLRLRIATKAEIADFRQRSPELARILDVARRRFAEGRPQ